METKKDLTGLLMKENKSTCSAPMKAIYLGDGGIAPCCVYKAPLTKNIEAYREFRTKNMFSFLRKDNPQCRSCNNKKSEGVQSRWDFFEAKSQSYSRDEKINYIDFSPSNICNLKCRMCSKYRSSSWSADEKKLQMIGAKYRRHIPEAPSFNGDHLEVAKALFLSEDIQVLDLKGGEPFLQNETRALLKFLVENKLSKSIHLNVTTNGTITDPHLFNLINSFKELTLQISFEGIGPLYDYIRGGKKCGFKSFVENIKIFNNNTNGNISLTHTLSALNILNLKETLDWVSSIREKHSIKTHFHSVVFEPAYLNPFILPVKELKKVGSNIKNYNFSGLSKIISKIAKVHLDQNHIDSRNRLLTLKKFCSDLDNIRNESLEISNPILHSVLYTN